jgi:hypothetical protein
LPDLAPTRRTLIGSYGAMISAVSDWQMGDRVRVLRGIFEGFPGIVFGVQSREVVVRVEIFDRTTLILFSPHDLGSDDEAGAGSGGVREPRSPSSSPGRQSARVLDD